MYIVYNVDFFDSDNNLVHKYSCENGYPEDIADDAIWDAEDENIVFDRALLFSNNDINNPLAEYDAEIAEWKWNY